jgi:hypothetical protein
MFAGLDTFNDSVFIKRVWDGIRENIKTATKRFKVIKS